MAAEPGKERGVLLQRKLQAIPLVLAGVPYGQMHTSPGKSRWAIQEHCLRCENTNLPSLDSSEVTPHIPA